MPIEVTNINFVMEEVSAHVISLFAPILPVELYSMYFLSFLTRLNLPRTTCVLFDNSLNHNSIEELIFRS